MLLRVATVRVQLLLLLDEHLSAEHFCVPAACLSACPAGARAA
eukprot:SAG22_NODE_3165_length_1887_cov_1.673378_4_plen_42_part_01